jgi:hypothetical protein
MTGNEHDPISSSATVSLMTLPNTGYPPDKSSREGSLARGLQAAVVGIGLAGIVLWFVVRKRGLKI